MHFAISAEERVLILSGIYLLVQLTGCWPPVVEISLRYVINVGGAFLTHGHQFHPVLIVTLTDMNMTNDVDCHHRQHNSSSQFAKILDPFFAPRSVFRSRAKVPHILDNVRSLINLRVFVKVNNRCVLTVSIANTYIVLTI